LASYSKVTDRKGSTTALPMDIDLKKHALEALEAAKDDLTRDGHLIPVAFIVTNLEILDFNLDYDDEDQKASAYAKLVEIAREQGGSAIITVNDARFGEPGTLDGYYPGKLEIEGAPECIYITVSGPAITTWSVTVPYVRRGKEIVFGNAIEAFDDSLNLLPGWPSGPQTVS
jgi:NAD(P)-dependent dehydrogenase (short-subunit alcohol dehydrogenase family)